MWNQEIMGNSFYDFPAQNPRVPVLLLGQSKHFWLLMTEPRSVLGLHYSTDAKQNFRDLLTAQHIRRQ